MYSLLRPYLKVVGMTCLVSRTRLQYQLVMYFYLKLKNTLMNKLHQRWILDFSFILSKITLSGNGMFCDSVVPAEDYH